YFTGDLPNFVGFTVPFGGNLYGALKCAQWIKQHHPHIPIAMGGGYPNTELRDLYDSRVFQYVDYITLDDGEGPLMSLLKNIAVPADNPQFIRTLMREKDIVVFKNNRIGGDYSHKQLPAPTYEGLRLKEYLSVIDMPNP
ncbi:MAG: radical SAM protein, partial [Flavobacteriales bacterium]